MNENKAKMIEKVCTVIYHCVMCYVNTVLAVLGIRENASAWVIAVSIFGAFIFGNAIFYDVKQENK